MTSAFKLRLNGYWLDSIAYTDSLTIRFAWSQDGGGFHEATWEMDLPVDFDHPALTNGAIVEVMDGGLRVGLGRLTEPGRTETGKSFIAQGIYRDAESFLCFDNATDQNSTSIADDAIDTAIGYGLLWKRPTSILTDPLKTGDDVEGLNYLNVLLSSVAVEQSKRWYVDADGAVHMAANATEPTWHIIPGVTNPGVADDDYATHLFGRYLQIVSGSPTLKTRNLEDPAASARWGYRQYGVDLLPLGSISNARVDNRLAGLLSRGKARLSFTDRIEVGPNEILTAGGRPASMSMVACGFGDVVRVHGLNAYSQWLNGNPYLDFVIGETEWQNGADSISIAPEQFSGRSLADRLTVRGAGNLVA